VIMPGLIGYAPEVYFILDVSYSMLPYIKRYMSVLQEVADGVVGRFGGQVTWVTVDTQIQNVGQMFTLDDATAAKMGFGWGGTDLGGAIELAAEEGVEFEGHQYPKADVIFVATDCDFPWPWQQEKRNPLSAELLIASTTDYERARGFSLPAWVDERDEFIHLPPRPPTVA